MSSCIIEFIKLDTKRDKCLASLAFDLFSSTCLINSIIHDHSCKIFNIELQAHDAQSTEGTNLGISF